MRRQVSLSRYTNSYDGGISRVLFFFLLDIARRSTKTFKTRLEKRLFVTYGEGLLEFSSGRGMR